MKGRGRGRPRRGAQQSQRSRGASTPRTSAAAAAPTRRGYARREPYIDKEVVATAMREYRKRECISQADLATYLGVSVRSVIRWELGEVLPMRVYWRAMRKLFRMDDEAEEFPKHHPQNPDGE